MGKDNILVGLEIGTSKMCVVVGESMRDGSIRVLGVGQAPSRGVRKGEIVDFETASACLRDALLDAEEKSDVMIESVFVGISGAHVESFNNRGSITIPDEQEEIEPADFEAVRKSAREVSIPAQNAFIHDILQHYHVDGQDGILNPIGMTGHKLEADFHIVHGLLTRIQNTVRCVKEIPLEVEDVIFNALATAQVVLTVDQKNLGALMIDIGGGTTDFIVYVEGAVKQSGVLAIGGDHITNDISMGLRIPMARAEKLKISEGTCDLGNAFPGEVVVLKDEVGFAGKEIERETLNTIIHMRAREIFELLKAELDQQNYLDFLGSGILLTGGCSQLKGIANLAQEIFEMPVQLTAAQKMSGLTSAFENPQFATAIGLIKYAQTVHSDRPTGFFSRLRSRFFGALRMFF